MVILAAIYQAAPSALTSLDASLCCSGEKGLGRATVSQLPNRWQTQVLTFAVHHTVVFVVLCSEPSQVQQPPGALCQSQWHLTLDLLQGDR